MLANNLMPLRKDITKVLGVAYQCIEVFIQLILAHVSSVYIVCLCIAVICLFVGAFSQAFVFVLFVPLFAIVASMQGLIVLGLPAILLFYLTGVKKRILWVLLGAFVAQASYYLFLNSLLDSKTDGINVLLGMPAIIGMTTGFIVQKRLYKNKSE